MVDDPIKLMELEEKRRIVDADKRREKAKKQLGKTVIEQLPVEARKGKALELVFYPDERLFQQCNPIDRKSSEIRKLGQDMLLTMYLCGGVGLSAPQIGRLDRIFVADWSGKKNQPVVVINPEILDAGKDKVSLTEGCLSFPAVRFQVPRPVTIRAHWWNDVGREYDQWLEGWAARIFLHEYDHLSGVTFIEKTSPLARRQALKKMGKIQLRMDRDMKKGRKKFQKRNWR